MESQSSSPSSASRADIVCDGFLIDFKLVDKHAIPKGRKQICFQALLYAEFDRLMQSQRESDPVKKNTNLALAEEFRRLRHKDYGKLPDQHEPRAFVIRALKGESK